MTEKSVMIVCPRVTGKEQLEPQQLLGFCESIDCLKHVALEPLFSQIPDKTPDEIIIYCLSCFCKRAAFSHFEKGARIVSARKVSRTEQRSEWLLTYPYGHKIKVIVMRDCNNMMIQGTEAALRSITCHPLSGRSA